jgi:hypothetical protein
MADHYQLACSFLIWLVIAVCLCKSLCVKHLCAVQHKHDVGAKLRRYVLENNGKIAFI